jgi:hypothetical protein
VFVIFQGEDSMKGVVLVTVNDKYHFHFWRCAQFFGIGCSRRFFLANHLGFAVLERGAGDITEICDLEEIGEKVQGRNMYHLRNLSAADEANTDFA